MVSGVSWDVGVTDQFADWYAQLDDDDTAAVNDAVDQLAEHGPGLRRPLVGHIERSAYHNMRELRAGSLRILFVWDPDREAALLLGGDKRHAGWNAWYQDAIKRADALYAEWLHDKGLG